jgi:hypothetical protein
MPSLFKYASYAFANWPFMPCVQIICRHHIIIVAHAGWIFRNRMYVKKGFDDIIFESTIIKRIEKLGEQLC